MYRCLLTVYGYHCPFISPPSEKPAFLVALIDPSTHAEKARGLGLGRVPGVSPTTEIRRQAAIGFRLSAEEPQRAATALRLLGWGRLGSDSPHALISGVHWVLVSQDVPFLVLQGDRCRPAFHLDQAVGKPGSTRSA